MHEHRFRRGLFEAGFTPFRSEPGPQEDMIKRIFAFADMQSNECTLLSEKRWKTNHDTIEGT